MRRGMKRWPRPKGVPAGLIVWMVLLAGCAGEQRLSPPAATSPAQARERIERSLPASLSDRAGWTTDLYAAFTVLGIAPSRENVCAVVAVIEQESGFQVDPVIPHLAAIAWREIDERAARAGVPRMVVHGVLQLKSAAGRSYAERIDNAKTEKELSDIYEDFIGAVPLGRTLFADRDPIRTRGPMQVHVAFAQAFAALKPYPYPVKGSIAEEVFSRRGGVYFGIAHLLAYSANYDQFRYRFADFNAGQYASRNAAFQHALAQVSGIPLAADGALLPGTTDTQGPGATERAARSIAQGLHLTDGAIHDALEQGKKRDFERTQLYVRVFALADEADGRAAPRALIPQIDLHGPKISRKLTTGWYASRVDARFERCLQGR